MTELGYGTALLLGILEGLTEFIPVSSTGHLILLGHALDLSGEKAETFEIFIQLGAILAVLVLYWKRFLALFDFKSAAHAFTGVSGLLRLALACGPVFLLGALFGSKIKSQLFFPTPVATALIVGGVAMYLVELRKTLSNRTSDLSQVSLVQSLVIGIAQCFSLWPGMSRSASTIIGGLLVGLDRKVAAEFSFFVAVPVMTVAVGYDMSKSYRVLEASDIWVFAFGFVVSFIVAMLAIKFFLKLLERFSLKPFAVYRIILGIVVLCALR